KSWPVHDQDANRGTRRSEGSTCTRPLSRRVRARRLAIRDEPGVSQRISRVLARPIRLACARAPAQSIRAVQTNIDGLDVHFIHQRSKYPDALPLILSHGWPGSFMEFHKMIGPLTDPVAYGGRAEDAFHVVIPSMPGYGFSDQPREKGFNGKKIAALFTTLMARLGYSRCGAQGGDIGAAINTEMALQDPSHMVGLHLNICGAAPPGRSWRSDGRCSAGGARTDAGASAVLQRRG